MGARRTFVGPDCDPKSTKLASVTPRVCVPGLKADLSLQGEQGMQVLQRKERRRGGWKEEGGRGEEWIKWTWKGFPWFLHYTEEWGLVMEMLGRGVTEGRRLWGAVWELRDQGAGSTKGQEDFMMAHMGEKGACCTGREGQCGVVLQRLGGEGQSEDPGSNSAQAEVLASSY